MMRRPFSVIATVVVGVAATAVLSTTAAAAEPQSTSASAPAAATSAVVPEHMRDLLELHTKQGKRFYTLSAEEAKTARERHGFTQTQETAGLHMYNREVAGTVPVHRLRLTGPTSAYILVSDPAELADLRDNEDDPWDFEYEGIVGHVHKDKTKGTVALHRFSKDNDWRVARSDRRDLPAAGYRDDGLIGFAPVD